VDGETAGVRAALSALDEAFERRDLNAVMNLCTEDVVFIGSGEGEETVGRDQIGPMFSALAPKLEGSEFTFGGWESVQVEILGDVALIYAWGPATLVTTRRDTSFRYRMTGVLVRDGSRWLWRVHHGSEPGSW
jgi:uncharacterized protein (TIGR02246 family)